MERLQQPPSKEVDNKGSLERIDESLIEESHPFSGNNKSVSDSLLDQISRQVESGQKSKQSKHQQIVVLSQSVSDLANGFSQKSSPRILLSNSRNKKSQTGSSGKNSKASLKSSSRSSRQKSNRVSIPKSSQKSSFVDPEPLIQNLSHYESPFPQTNLPKKPIGSGSMKQSRHTTSMNPMESPDPVTVSRVPISARNPMQDDTPSSDGLRLRNIRKVPEGRNDSSSGAMSSSADPRESLIAIQKKHNQSLAAPVLHISPDNLGRRGGPMSSHFLSTSVDRFNNIYHIYGQQQNKDEEEVQLLKKQLREEKSKFEKQRAVQEQQVELLTFQLHEASDREKKLKNTYEAMMLALQKPASSVDFSVISQSASRTEIASPRQTPDVFSEIQNQKLDQTSKMENQENKQPDSVLTESPQAKAPISARSPKQTAKAQLPPSSEKRSDFMSRMPDPKGQAPTTTSKLGSPHLPRGLRNSVRASRKSHRAQASSLSPKKPSMQDLHDRIQYLESQVQSQLLQLQAQETLLVQKEREMIELRTKFTNTESALKQVRSHEEDHEALQNALAKAKLDFQKEAERSKADKEKQLREVEDHYSQIQQEMNTRIIDLQKEIQTLNSELDSHMKIVYMKDLRCMELDKQVTMHENQVIQAKKDQEKQTHTHLVELEQRSIDMLAKETEIEEMKKLVDDLKLEMEAKSKDNLDLQQRIIDLSKLDSPSADGGPQETLTDLDGFKFDEYSKKGSMSRKTSIGSNGFKKKSVGNSPDPYTAMKELRPVKMRYWNSKERFIDDGGCSKETVNGLRRLVSELRSQNSRMLVVYNDLKAQSQKEIARLNKVVEVEKQRRLTIQEDKLEKSTQLMHELTERDKKIIQLQNELRELRTDKVVDFESNNGGLNHTRQSGLRKRTRSLEKSLAGSLYKSQSVYNKKGFKHETSQFYSKRRQTNKSSISQRSLEFSAVRKSKKGVGALGRKKSPGYREFTELTDLKDHRIQTERSHNKSIEREAVTRKIFGEDLTQQQVADKLQELNPPGYTDRFLTQAPGMTPNASEDLVQKAADSCSKSGGEEVRPSMIPLRINSPVMSGEQNRLLTMKSLDQLNFKQYITEYEQKNQNLRNYFSMRQAKESIDQARFMTAVAPSENQELLASPNVFYTEDSVNALQRMGSERDVNLLTANSIELKPQDSGTQGQTHHQSTQEMTKSLKMASPLSTVIFQQTQDENMMLRKSIKKMKQGLYQQSRQMTSPQQKLFSMTNIIEESQNFLDPDPTQQSVQQTAKKAAAKQFSECGSPNFDEDEISGEVGEESQINPNLHSSDHQQLSAPPLASILKNTLEEGARTFGDSDTKQQSMIHPPSNTASTVKQTHGEGQTAVKVPPLVLTALQGDGASKKLKPAEPQGTSVYSVKGGTLAKQKLSSRKKSKGGSSSKGSSSNALSGLQTLGSYAQNFNSQRTGPSASLKQLPTSTIAPCPPGGKSLKKQRPAAASKKKNSISKQFVKYQSLQEFQKIGIVSSKQKSPNPLNRSPRNKLQMTNPLSSHFQDSALQASPSAFDPRVQSTVQHSKVQHRITPSQVPASRGYSPESKSRGSKQVHEAFSLFYSLSINYSTHSGPNEEIGAYRYATRNDAALIEAGVNAGDPHFQTTQLGQKVSPPSIRGTNTVAGPIRSQQHSTRKIELPVQGYQPPLSSRPMYSLQTQAEPQIANIPQNPPGSLYKALLSQQSAASKKPQGAFINSYMRRLAPS